MNTEELLIDFYNGALLLRAVATWAHVATNPARVLEQLASFEHAYEKLVELHGAGKLGVGAADFSAQNLEHVKRLLRLVQPGTDSREARQSADEVRCLAERCLAALLHEDTPPNEAA